VPHRFLRYEGPFSFSHEPSWGSWILFIFSHYLSLRCI
jgi:hypothetical protein